MRHRDRAALLDLPPEDWDHAPGRVQDVAEPDGDEPSRDIGAVSVGLDDPLAHSLGLSHQALRARGLVGRNENEPCGAVLDGDIGHDLRRKGVVPDRFEGVRLEHRHVLVRGCVEDHGGLVALEDLAHLRPVAAVAEHGGDGRKRALIEQLPLEVEERPLGFLDEHKPCRSEARDLTAELRADRPAGAGDEHRLAGEVRGNRRDVDLDRLSSEDVLHLDRPDLTREVEVACDQLVEARQRLHGDARVAGDLDDAAAILTRGGRDREQYLVPRTRTPCSRRFFLRGSSSMRPIGV